jgi:hypothetical protein
MLAFIYEIIINYLHNILFELFVTLICKLSLIIPPQMYRHYIFKLFINLNIFLFKKLLWRTPGFPVLPGGNTPHFSAPPPPGGGVAPSVSKLYQSMARL